MVVIITPYKTIFTQCYNNYYYYGNTRNICMYTKSLNALINICKYLNSSAVWCFSHSLDYKMIDLTEIEPICLPC